MKKENKNMNLIYPYCFTEKKKKLLEIYFLRVAKLQISNASTLKLTFKNEKFLTTSV